MREIGRVSGEGELRDRSGRTQTRVSRLTYLGLLPAWVAVPTIFWFWRGESEGICAVGMVAGALSVALWLRSTSENPFIRPRLREVERQLLRCLIPIGLICTLIAPATASGRSPVGTVLVFVGAGLDGVFASVLWMRPQAQTGPGRLSYHARHVLGTFPMVKWLKAERARNRRMAG